MTQESPEKTESDVPTTNKAYTGQEQAGAQGETAPEQQAVQLDTPTTDEVYTGQEEAAESTKDADSVKAVADPSGEGGGELPEWPNPIMENSRGGDGPNE